MLNFYTPGRITVPVILAILATPSAAQRWMQFAEARYGSATLEDGVNVDEEEINEDVDGSILARVNRSTQQFFGAWGIAQEVPDVYRPTDCIGDLLPENFGDRYCENGCASYAAESGLGETRGAEGSAMRQAYWIALPDPLDSAPWPSGSLDVQLLVRVSGCCEIRMNGFGNA
ncbi:MAG: hypothetical protein KDA28_11140, partial [Phycisphaerales bacterium]|nr:hypothetical protein [Phycisphaerales bacterium]